MTVRVPRLISALTCMPGVSFELFALRSEVVGAKLDYVR
jgi:hypothetical protein